MVSYIEYGISPPTRRQHYSVPRALIGLIIYGTLQHGWYLNEITTVFLVGAIAVGLVARYSANKIARTMVAGAQKLTAGALIIGVARGIQVVLENGRIGDTIIHALSMPLENLPPLVSAILMSISHSVINFFIPSGSGQAMATMPIMLPLSDLIGISPQTAILAFQLGDGVMNLVIPTLGGLLAMIALARVPFDRWRNCMTSDQIRAAVLEVEPKVVKLRRRLHRRPELGFQEHKTAALVAEELKQLPLEVVTGVYGTGVCAVLRGGGTAGRRGFGSQPAEEPTILLRADMDALPIQEQTGLEYASEIPGVMHACGHDGHTAILLGTAMVLARFKDELPGNVKFVFQPAEETEGGAEGMIEAGVLKNPTVDAAVGLHLWGDAPKGIVEYKAGPLMASPDGFRIRITGRGGHAAKPYACIDPIPVAAAVVQQLQTIVSRETDPFDAAVVSVCRVQAGTAHNIIPNEALLEGTTRALVPEVRERLAERIEQIAKQTAAAAGAACEVEYTFKFPPLINDAEVTELVRVAAEQQLGTARVREAARPNMGGEDFACFAQALPSSFFYLGIAPSEDRPVPHHHPEFKIDDEVLKDGIAVFCRTVAEFFAR